MRSYFWRNNRIEGVELLEPGPDEALTEQAEALFEVLAGQGFVVGRR